MPELEVLLSPITEAAPCGEDLSFSAEFDAILEARRADDPSLEQGEWITDLKTADWPAVSALCAQLLQQRGKDLRVAGWWAEAEARTRGFQGLADGYRLIAGLCDRYWEQLHPMAEHGDEEQRIGNLGWVLTHSIDWLRALPLVDAAQGRFGLGDFEAAHARRGDGAAADAVSPEQLEMARRGSSHAFYVALMAAVPDCRQALSTLETAVDARLQQDGPSFSAVREQLDRVQDMVRRFARDAGVLVDGVAANNVETGATVIAATTTAGDALASRREALAQLRRVAEYFRRTEPHSPVAYLADKAARWGEMPLHVWLKRVIKDDAALSQVEELLDIGEGSRE